MTWQNVHGDVDLALLDAWLAGGHELGNHTRSHLDYTKTEPVAYLADVEAGRSALAAFLAPRGAHLRFSASPTSTKATPRPSSTPRARIWWSPARPTCR